jgi:hypothetical protein
MSLAVQRHPPDGTADCFGLPIGLCGELGSAEHEK